MQCKNNYIIAFAWLSNLQKWCWLLWYINMWRHSNTSCFKRKHRTVFDFPYASNVDKFEKKKKCFECIEFSYFVYIVELPNNSYKPITNTAWVRARLCKLQKRCTRLAAASDKVYQLLAHGRWFFPGTLASSTTKTGRHDIAKILLKLALSTINK